MSARLVSLGEVMLRMSPPRFQRMRSTRTFDVHVAGAQLNVAADFARLGGEGAFVSRLPANELGALAYDACLSYGVDMRHVQRVEGARMGVNYLEFSPSPRAPVAIFRDPGTVYLFDLLRGDGESAVPPTVWTGVDRGVWAAPPAPPPPIMLGRLRNPR